MLKPSASSLILVLFLGLIAGAQNATSPAPQKYADYLNKLSPAMREKAEALIAQAEEFPRARLVGELARDAANTADFLIAFSDSEKSPRVRLAIVDNLGRQNHPQIKAFLERAVTTDADANVSKTALERLRVQRHLELRNLLLKRLEMARTQNDAEGLRLLSEEQERWISLVRGTMLPAFLRKPPELFSLKPENQPIRVLAFGDFGTGSEQQKQTAAAMLAVHRKTPFDFGLTLGDNFYSLGMASPQDPRWKTWWEEVYGP